MHKKEVGGWMVNISTQPDYETLRLERRATFSRKMGIAAALATTVGFAAGFETEGSIGDFADGFFIGGVGTSVYFSANWAFLRLQAHFNNSHPDQENR